MANLIQQCVHVTIVALVLIGRTLQIDSGTLLIDRGAIVVQQVIEEIANELLGKVLTAAQDHAAAWCIFAASGMPQTIRQVIQKACRNGRGIGIVKFTPVDAGLLGNPHSQLGHNQADGTGPTHSRRSALLPVKESRLSTCTW